MDGSDKKAFRTYVEDAEFEKAYSIARKLSNDIVEETLTNICAEETGNTTHAIASSVLVVYFYVQYSLFKEKKAEKYHYIDFLTAAFPADFLIGDGCYAIGCSSMKEACKLDPDNVAYKEDLLHYYDRVPGDKGTYLSEEEAKSIREEINALNG
ncbi:hypothetical protein D3P96_00730 [Weissella viridescens]|uniref:Uncharacterized protein n=1 Tax=Weissella viridescens TaxID=1629 RepID=A0A3P2RD37_WEIVI|nr:hypothetical protein [Weissella viridescens]RRG18543.1 hypothetical protein D3P96_00730 [Weissella viridescens]